MKAHAMQATARRTRRAEVAVPEETRAVQAHEREAMIAEAAYYRAEARGFEAGHELEDWLAAECEIDLLLEAERFADH
ncbi:MAG: DUF2934 domain-containing protein [Steroidobacteraceae bacterium]